MGRPWHDAGSSRIHVLKTLDVRADLWDDLRMAAERVPPFREGTIMTTPTIDPKVFQGLQITPSDEPLPEPARGTTAGPNPFTDPLTASVEHSKAYSVYLPPEAVQRAVFLINSAARKANIGARVVVNIKRDKDNKPIKDKNGKTQPIAETDGPNKGKVLVRFQGLKQRKQQTAPRPYSIVKDKQDGNVYHVRRRADKINVFTGTHEAAKAEYDRLKHLPVPTPEPAQAATPTGTAQPTEQSQVSADQGTTTSEVEPAQQAAQTA